VNRQAFLQASSLDTKTEMQVFRNKAHTFAGLKFGSCPSFSESSPHWSCFKQATVADPTVALACG
jgi:hypothetical protein